MRVGKKQCSDYLCLHHMFLRNIYGATTSKIETKQPNIEHNQGTLELSACQTTMPTYNDDHYQSKQTVPIVTVGNLFIRISQVLFELVAHNKFFRMVGCLGIQTVTVLFSLTASIPAVMPKRTLAETNKANMGQHDSKTHQVAYGPKCYGLDVLGLVTTAIASIFFL